MPESSSDSYSERADLMKLAPTGGVAPLVSLCMIARDNELTIREALATARPWVDEIIVVDTGSIDQTPSIAAEFGARIEHFPWCDDFAAARNQSLGYATGQWIFWMDTDDTLPPECGKRLRDALQQGFPDDVLGLIMQVHCPSNAGSTPARGAFTDPKRASSPDSLNTGTRTKGGNSGGGDLTVVDHVKVLRNRPDLRFEGRIHEQILPSIRRAGGRVVWTESYVVHSGSDHSPEGSRRKLDRDLRLLRLDVQERPNHPFVLFNLGMTLLHRKDFLEARTHLEHCIEIATTDESHLRKAYALLVDTLERMGDHGGARRRCWEGLGRYPNDLELAFQLGRSLMLNRQWKEAIDAFQRVLKAGNARYFASIDPGIRHFKTLANLATCHEELGQHFEALGAWRACLNDAPGFVDGWEGILRVCREINQTEPLARFYRELQDEPEARGFAYVCQAFVFSRQGHVDEAVGCFEQALQSTNQHVFVLNEYGRILCEHQRWIASIPVLVRLCDLDPNNPSPHFNLGVSLRHSGRFEEATEELQTALRLRPGHRPTHALLRECNRPVTLIHPGTGAQSSTKVGANETDYAILSITDFGGNPLSAGTTKSGAGNSTLTPVLSICVSLKNRSKIEHDGNELKLFYHCVRSIAEAAGDTGPIELVVADFQSTDWPLKDWIGKASAGLMGRILEISGPFSRGVGLNLAAKHASSDRLLLLDADMLVTPELLAHGIECLDNGNAFFPIFRHLSPSGEPGALELASFGNAFITRPIFDAVGGVPEFKSWGGEDDIFHESVCLHSTVLREPIDGFLHQWHPESARHEHYSNPVRSDYFSYFQATPAQGDGEA